MELGFRPDTVFLSILSLSLLVLLGIGTWRFVTKYDNPGSVFDYKVVRQLPLWFALILLAINIAMAMYSAGVEPEDPSEKMSVVTRAILHLSLETIGFMCLLGVAYFLFCIIYCIIIWRRYNKELRGNPANKKKLIEYRTSAIRFTFLFVALLFICIFMGIYGPYKNTYLVAVAVNQEPQLDWWFRETFHFMFRVPDYSLINQHVVDHSLLKPNEFIQRGGELYLPSTYSPFKDMVFRLKCMVILFQSNLIFAVGKGLLSVPHYMIVLEKDMQDLIEGKTDLAGTIDSAARESSSTGRRSRSNRRGSRGRGSRNRDTSRDTGNRRPDSDENYDDTLSEADIEEYLIEALEFFGYEEDEIMDKVDEALDNYRAEDEERVIVQVSNKLASIHQSILKFEEDSQDMSEQEYATKGLRTAKSIARVLKGSVARNGGFSISLSIPKAERKFKA